MLLELSHLLFALLKLQPLRRRQIIFRDGLVTRLQFPSVILELPIPLACPSLYQRSCVPNVSKSYDPGETQYPLQRLTFIDLELITGP